MCRFETIICPKCKVKQFRAVPKSAEISPVEERPPAVTHWVCGKHASTGVVCVYNPVKSFNVIAKDVEMLCSACQLLWMWVDARERSMKERI